MRVLLVYGGTRIGDTFHAIPLLKELKDKGIDCDWIYGKYEREVCILLKKLGLVGMLIPTTFIVGEAGHALVNPDMGSIDKFITYVHENEEEVLGGTELPIRLYHKFSDYDAVITPEKIGDSFNGLFTSTEDIGIDFEKCPWASNNIPDVIIDGYKGEGDYIGCQPASVSDFKTYEELYHVDFPGEVKSFGFSGERPIPNSFSIHGVSLEEVYQELQTCGMFVSTHSAIGLLAYYLGVPLIFISFWKNLANLAKRDNVIQLEVPTVSELDEAVDAMYSEHVLYKEEIMNAKR